MAGEGKQDLRTAGQSIPAGAEVKQEAVSIPEDTAATEPDTERQGLITAVNRSCGRRENAVSCIRKRPRRKNAGGGARFPAPDTRKQKSLRPFRKEQLAALEARSGLGGAEAGLLLPGAEARARRQEGHSPLRSDIVHVRQQLEQTDCLPEFRRRFRRKKDVAV